MALILILAFGVHGGGLSSRISSLKDTVSNLTLSLSSALNDNRDAMNDARRVWFSVESNEERLRSVAESLKQLPMVASLNKAVTSLKCALDQVVHNHTGCCPLQWERFDSSCFFFSHVTLNWPDARDWCHAHQSQLLILTSHELWNYVRSNTGSKFHWVGLANESGKWQWVSGTQYAIDHRRWTPGRPDAAAAQGQETKDCVHLQSNGLLNDARCSERMRYICHAHGAVGGES